MAQGPCPACSKTAEMKPDANRDVNHVDCPYCGSYAIQGTFHFRITKGLFFSKKEKEFVELYMADYIRDEKPEIVDSPDTDPKAYEYYAQRRRQRQRLNGCSSSCD